MCKLQKAYPTSHTRFRKKAPENLCTTSSNLGYMISTKKQENYIALYLPRM